MRKIFLSLVITTAFFACKQPIKGANGVTYKSAVEYNDYIVTRQTSLMKNIVVFGDLAQPYPDSARKMLKKYTNETAGYITELKGMPPYHGDSTFRDAGIAIFTFYKKIVEDDYQRILDLNENMTEENSVIANNIIKNLSKEEEKLDKNFHNAQVEFAEKNKMKLVENEMQKKVDDMK